MEGEGNWKAGRRNGTGEEVGEEEEERKRRGGEEGRGVRNRRERAGGNDVILKRGGHGHSYRRCGKGMVLLY